VLDAKHFAFLLHFMIQSDAEIICLHHTRKLEDLRESRKTRKLQSIKICLLPPSFFQYLFFLFSVVDNILFNKKARYFSLIVHQIANYN